MTTSPDSPTPATASAAGAETAPATATHWAGLVANLWGDGDGAAPVLTPLYGEYDLNFRAEDPTGAPSVVKVMRAGCQPEDIRFQTAMIHALQSVEGVPVPQILPTAGGDLIAGGADQHGEERLIWRLGLLPGTTLDQHRLTEGLIAEIGDMIARMHAALADFSDPALERSFKWDLCAADWISPHLSLFDGEPALKRQLVSLLDWYESAGRAALSALPRQPIHNDLNLHNLLAVSEPGQGPRLSGLLDFGDALLNPRICDLAIAGSYLASGEVRPVEAMAALVEGYTRHSPLSAAEIDCLWPLMLMRLAVSVTNSGLQKQQFPDDPYVVISEAPTLALLAQVRDLDPRFTRERLRAAAGLPASLAPLPARFDGLHPMFDADVGSLPVLDLTPDNVALSANRTQPDAAELDAVVDTITGQGTGCLGRWGEARLIYGGEGFGRTDHVARRRRTVHIGLDVFLPPETEVRAVLPGRVVFAGYRPERHDYGGTLVLEHQPGDGPAFRALYGHLSKASADRLSAGDSFAAGDVIAWLGDVPENGGWPPHLHLQLGGSDAPNDPGAWPGVVDADDWDLWAQLFPNPATLAGVEPARVDARPPTLASMRARRAALTTANLKLSYSDPVHMIRGQGCTLIDAEGRRFLDAYNNVPHVGHAHPHVAARVAEQVQRLSTNTRYLSELHLDYAEALLARFPYEFDTCFLVNSGSEANEVAMRLATTFTGRRDMAVSEVGYHGITQKALDISHYKFAGKGGQGQADWVHVLPIPNTFSGPFTGADAPARYTGEAESLIAAIGARGAEHALAACLLEIYPSVGGQLIPPQGYLQGLQRAVHAAGGLLIADEVQTGMGRLGHHFWAFEQQGLKPDIVVLGKPIGNGHPMGAVLTRKEIGDAFNNGMEFFSTFGGSTVSCAAGRAVLEVIEHEGLEDRAARAGATMLEGLSALFSRSTLPADVRGLGLFLGVEICEADGSPATAIVGQLVNAMRRRRILMGSDGPHDSVLKIRPPICFDAEDAAFFLEAMEDSLREVGLV